MSENSDKTILEILEQGFIIFSKNGIIRKAYTKKIGNSRRKEWNIRPLCVI